MRFLLNLKPSTAHHVREQIEDEGAMWANKWYALMQPFVWLASYFAFYTYSEGSFTFRRLPLSGQFVYLGQKMFRDRDSDPVKRRKRSCGFGVRLNFFDGDGDTDLGFSISLFLFSFYLTLRDILPRKWQPKSDYKTSFGATRCACFYYNERAFWMAIWQDDGGSSGKQPWYMKMFVFHLPWDSDWVRTSYLLKNQMWLHETKGNRKDWKYSKETDAMLWQESHPYQYTLKSGEVQNITATIGVSEREWRWRWFKWLPLTKSVSRTIDVEFSEEVGEGRGSWKGGTLGCGFNMLADETPIETLKRMEQTRRFDR